MKKIVFLLLLCISCSDEVFPQPIQPGGVPGAKIWVHSEQSEDGKISWSNRLSAGRNGFRMETVGSPSGEGKFLNFNPALFLDGFNQELKLLLEGPVLSESTFFTVYQPEDAYWEKTIWHYEINHSNRLILTTHRVADLERVNYLNFSPKRIDLPRINTYASEQKESEELVDQHRLRFAKMPERGNLPVTSFKGIIPEVIVFDRILTAKERIQVETYLALKYGISLSQPGYTFLLNSGGDVIWNGKDNPDFPSHIAGIGRDDASGLYQKQSASSYNPALLTIGAGEIAENNSRNRALMPDKSFLIWGDNQQPLLFEKEVQGHPERLGRKWSVTASGSVAGMKTEVRLGIDQLEETARPGEVYWLVIDRSGTGNFPPGAIEYRKADKIASDKTVVFQNVSWDEDQSGKDVFAIAAGPGMIPKAWITPPTCRPQENGQIHVGAEGGRPPYRFSLANAAEQYEKNWIAHSNDIQDIDGIAPGTYTLTITDSDNTRYEEDLYIQSSDAPVSALASHYVLKPGQPLKLDASAGIRSEGITYCWIDPDGAKTYSPGITITQAGNYQLVMERIGCESRHQIVVAETAENPFKNLVLYPNPIREEGVFNVEINLEKPVDVALFIYDATGRLVQHKTLSGAQDYFFTGKMMASGNYNVKIQSEGFTQTLSLIVE